MVGKMTYMNMGRGSLDYFPCRYGEGKTMFRGPKRKAEGDYIAFLGGTETFGKFVARPFPRIVEEQTGQPALNLGMAHAGPDAYLADDTLLRIASVDSEGCWASRAISPVAALCSSTATRDRSRGARRRMNRLPRGAPAR